MRFKHFGYGKANDLNAIDVSRTLSDAQIEHTAKYDLWNLIPATNPKTLEQLRGTLKVLYSTLVDHPLSKETQKEIDHRRFIWKPRNSKTTVGQSKFVPTVKTYGGIEHMLSILEHLHGEGAPMEQDVTSSVMFFKTLQWIKDTMGLMTNEQLLLTLQHIHNTLLSLIDETNDPSIPRTKPTQLPPFIRHVLPKGKLFIQNLEEQASSVLWGIRFVTLYDKIEKRQAHAAVHKRFPTKVVIIPTRDVV
jgi:hypothetical protein